MPNRFKAYVPEDCGSEEAKKFVDVLDQAHLHKTIVLDALPRAFNPLTVSKVDFLQKYLRDLGGLELIPGFPRCVYENLILNAAAIYALKGTPRGLTLFLEILTKGSVVFNTSNLHNGGDFIIPDDILGDRALLQLSYPNTDAQTDEDLQKYSDTIAGNTTNFYFLFDGDSYDSGLSSMEIHILTPFAGIFEFREYLRTTLPQFLCMLVPETGSISVYLYDHAVPVQINAFNTLIQDITIWP